MRNNSNVIIKNSEDDVYTLISFNIPADDNSEILFVVEDIENPIIYKESWESRKPLSVCCNMFCKKHYFKERNKDTCSDKCSKKLKEKQDQDVAWEEHIITVKNKIVV